MKAVYRKELNSYFCSMTGYVFIAFMVIMTGMYFTLNNVSAGNPYFTTALTSALYIMLIAIPVLTMRSMAEERRSKTDQALLTSPNSSLAIIAGKYAALITVFAVPMAISLIYPLIIRSFGTWHPAADYAGILVFFLIGCTCISIGLFISCLTENQLIAAVVTFVILLLVYLWDTLIGYLPMTPESTLAGFIAVCVLVFAVIRAVSGSTPAAGIIGAACAVTALVFYFVKRQSFAGLLEKLLSNFSLTAPLNSVKSANVLDIRGIILYITMTFLFLFLSVRSIENRKWN